MLPEDLKDVVWNLTRSYIVPRLIKCSFFYITILNLVPLIKLQSYMDNFLF